jgi:hypothetical protein
VPIVNAFFNNPLFDKNSLPNLFQFCS